MTEVTEVIKNSKSDSILFAHKAFLLLEDQQADEALELCEAGVKRYPFYAEGHFVLGKCYQSKRNYDAAKEEYERTLVFMPGHIRALNALSFIYHKKNLPAKGNELLLLAAVHNPFNDDLINYLKNENLYNQLYAESVPKTETALKPEAAIELQAPEEAIDEVDTAVIDDQKITEELVSEIGELMPEGEDELASFDVDTALTEWEREADQIKAEDLLPFSFSEKDIEDSTIEFDDSQIIDFEKDHGSDLEEKLFRDERKSAGKKNADQVVWEPEKDTENRESELFEEDINDLAKQESELDDSFLLDEEENDDFFLEPENSGQVIPADENESERIEKYASSKDEITELSIEKYEVNSIVDNIIESDKKDTGRADLSKFANTEDDFSSLMDGIFKGKSGFEDDELFGDEQDDDLDTAKLDDTELAEERPILDTSIIFPNRPKDVQKVENDVLDSDEIKEEQILDEDIEFDFSPADSEVEQEDEITKVIDKIEKAGERPRKPVIRESKKPKSAEEQEEDLAPLDDENVNIEEILANPKMLTPTFGEILIAQKKFEDARRVFSELSKRDPGNARLARKIDFLDKLVHFNK